ncbi:MAG: anaerobic ribonucleoside-triphosphate reductase activating protein [Candidatus Nezhaarchaeales archaeon]
MKKAKVRIGGIVDISTVDWPSKVCSVIFFSGCNFGCPYCQNGKLVDANYGREFEVDDMVKLVLRSKPLIDGVVITGGECTLQSEGLMELCRNLKKHSLNVGIDTNGSMPEVVESMIKENVIDRVALDVKAPLDPKIYEKVIGLPGHGEDIVKKVEKTLNILLNSSIEVEVRILIVPNLMDDVNHVKMIAKRVKGVTRLVIQQFRPEADLLDPSLKALKPPTRQELLIRARAALDEGVENVYIRTRENGLERVKRWFQ